MPDLSVMSLSSSKDSSPLQAERSDSQAPAWASLLGLFYAQAGMAFPELVRCKGPEMPQPYRSLLVHSRDMTPTLEDFYQQELTLKVLSRKLEHQTYLREVTLDLKDSGKPIEYGAIRIFTSLFPPAAREMILHERCPLGKILQLEGIPHVGWPQAFFSVAQDQHMASNLRIKTPGVLYGRRNVLLDGSRQLLAEVFEVLAPVAKP
jgi:hypothetical protein